MPPAVPPASRIGASDSMPSTAMPSATLSNMSCTPGSCVASVAARCRTSSVSNNSRHGGAHRPCSATSRLRWSATLNQRISSTVSPQNSTRTGCSSVGGKTSRMPPRTANSPRRSTKSVRVYAAPANASTTSGSSASCPIRNDTGARSPSPLAIGCISARTLATTTAISPYASSCVSGWASRRSTASRRPTVSLRGLSRSCGSVSQLGNSTTCSAGRKPRRLAARSCASRPVAVTASTVRAGRSPPPCATRAVSGPRAPDAQAMSTTSAVPTCDINRATASSRASRSSTGCKLTGEQLLHTSRAAGADTQKGPVRRRDGVVGINSRRRLRQRRERQRAWMTFWASVRPLIIIISTASAASGTRKSNSLRSLALKSFSTYAAASIRPGGRPMPTRTRR